MSHFYGKIEGQARTLATRGGSAKSGLRVWANGWNFGVLVILFHEDKTDHASVYLTGGSNERDTPVLVGTFTKRDLEERRDNPKPAA